MGIQPIDLQTMYSQLSNVSKTMSASQHAQLTEAMQQQNNIQKNLENASKVQQTSNEKSTTNNVNQNGSNSTFYGNSGKKNQNQNDNDNSDDQWENHPSKNDLSYLGTIIDITR